MKACPKCDKLILPESKLCRECQFGNSQKREATLKEYKAFLSVKGKHPSWLTVHVRSFNRSWNKGLLLYPCQVCGYKNHIELAHIKPVSSFEDDALISTINDPSNILVLCPNHHWEFDNGLIKLEEIPVRNHAVLET